MDLSILLKISEDLGFSDITTRLQTVEEKINEPNCPIVLPLVGEFSSGKTSLINALTDSKKLETSTKPTTSTIYEIHFGSEKEFALVIKGEDQYIEIEDLSSLKNSELSNADYVKVFDTSNKISNTILLIDTPGLSSSDPRHRQALVSFLPEADGILIVMDINAQLTRSTIDFVNTVSLSGRPIYLILTKCDTKTSTQVNDTITYINNEHQLPFKRIIRTSASIGSIDEMYSLLDDIQKDKSSILEKVFSKRIEALATEIVSRIDTLLNATHDEKSIQEEINKQRLELSKITRKINRIIEDVDGDIQTAKQNACRKFEDLVFGKLDSLVAGKSTNFDSEAYSIINNSSSLTLNNFKNEVRSIVANAVKFLKDADISLSSVSEIDMSEYSIDGISYNLNLNEIGHEYDSKIAAGLKIAAAVAAVAATAGAASGAVGEGLCAMDMIEVADTVSDEDSIISNHNTVQCIQGLVSSTQNEYDYIEQTQQGIGQRFGSETGIVDSLVGFVTDSTMGKPQRRRAIHEYMDGSLIPSYKSELDRISSEVVLKIKQTITAEVALSINEVTSKLEELKQTQKSERQAFEEHLSLLRSYRAEILTL